ncbi:MAG: response regulator transcription factor [Flavobacteriaceae bacterium]|nr:response regulator transcription factor [Flavobacteriaceae bacterium]
MNPTIFIADDHPLLLNGFEKFLIEKKYNVIGKEKDGRSALNFILKHRPEIAILDLEMPKMSGIEIVEECQKKKIETKIIILTFHKNVDYYLKAKKLNIYGYLLKDFALDEIEICLEAVIKNKYYFSEKIKEVLNFTEESPSIFDRLTMTEITILKLVAFSKTNKEISDMLFVSYRTIEKHRSNIIAKLELPQKTGSLLKWVQKNKHIFVV